MALALTWVASLGLTLAPARVPAADEPGTRPDSRSVRKLFLHPPKQYSSAPLWVRTESRGQGLAVEEVSAAPPASELDVVGVYRIAAGRVEDLGADWRAGRLSSAPGPLVIAKVRHANRSDVNPLTPGVTGKHLEVTLGAYDRELTRKEWNRVAGVFTDGPNTGAAGGFPWCPDFAAEFLRRRGYDLLGNLPAMVREVGDWRRIRHDYFTTANELFIERLAKPCYEACEKRGLEFTGHYRGHDWPDCPGVPDNMAMAAWQHRPGIETPMNRYAETTPAQFRNVRACREISSLANQLGRERTRVELSGTAGGDLRFEDMKRIADWLQVLGINTMGGQPGHVTVRGAGKRDQPPSITHHFHEDYLARLSAVLSRGDQVNRILVLEPTSTAWMYQGNGSALGKLGDSFTDLLMALEADQIEYDLGCEDVIARHGAAVGGAALGPSWASSGALKIGLRKYPLVIVPEHTETLNPRTRSLLEDVLAAGGQVIGLGPIPPRTGGVLDPSIAENRTVQRRWATMGRDALLGRVREATANQDIVIDRAAGDRGILFHHRREWADGQVLFLVNSSSDQPSRGRIRARLGGVEHWNPASGRIEREAFTATRAGVAMEFELPPGGSRLLIFSRKIGKPAVPGQGSEPR